MKTAIHIDEAVRLLESCSGVIVESDGCTLPYITFPDLTSETSPDAVFLIVAPDNSGDNDTCFTNEDNEGAETDNHGRLYLTAQNGDEVVLTLLAPMSL